MRKKPRTQCKHISAKYAKFPSVDSARTACFNMDPPCGGVYDTQCNDDGLSPIYLCNRGATLEHSTSGGCVYGISVTVVHHCKCKNGIPADGDR